MPPKKRRAHLRKIATFNRQKRSKSSTRAKGNTQEKLSGQHIASASPMSTAIKPPSDWRIDHINHIKVYPSKSFLDALDTMETGKRRLYNKLFQFYGKCLGAVSCGMGMEARHDRTWRCIMIDFGENWREHKK